MTPRVVVAAAAVASLLGVAACASNSSSGERPARPQAQRTSRDVITAEELAKSSEPTALRAVEALRPTWLLVRGNSQSKVTREEVVVYVAGNRYGSVSTLSQLAASAIQELRFLDGREATTRFGTGHGAGAILVTLKR